MIIPEDGTGHLVDRVHNLWRTLVQIERKCFSNKRDGITATETPLGFPTIYHYYDMVVSLKSDNRLQPRLAQLSSVAR